MRLPCMSAVPTYTHCMESWKEHECRARQTNIHKGLQQIIKQILGLEMKDKVRPTKKIKF